MAASTEYCIWSGIKKRCYNKNSRKYKDYGGRGITMCDEWRESFEAFYADMGPRPSLGHSIDRKNNDEGYSKENCRWATAEEQQNNKRSNLLHELDGILKTLTQWCRELEMNYHTIYQRIYVQGMSFEEAIVTK
ncbi:hypothetical protein [Ralstonia phage RP12]|uniref:Uncharacterized protein n=1 Tax=Ralstonia phage RP12 TaxID=1923889 RepID=A0A1L7N0I9_9CAUD|nr:HNH endonuclease [Ralstonia phage RP12]BAW18975.1 hypothetical protein [Ralstonia phage RP12]